jgi:hypothetical protein
MAVSRTQVIVAAMLLLSVPVVADVVRNGNRLQLAGIIAAYTVAFAAAGFFWWMMRRK